jgi:hypothetical protein
MTQQEQSDSYFWQLIRSYLVAKETVINKGFGEEIDWQDKVALHSISDEVFLSECAWVILSSGMRETVIRKKFGPISNAFFEWKSVERIVASSDLCRAAALVHFNHRSKIDAIITMAENLHHYGLGQMINGIKDHGADYLCQFPFFGPATSVHLAKNIGLPVAKPDRHLKRLAHKAGYASPQCLCRDISDLVGDKLSVVDLVLWRYATLHKNYLDIFPLRADYVPDKQDCGFSFIN